MPLELCHDFSGLEPPSVSPKFFHQTGSYVQQRNVLDNHPRNAGAQYLHGDFSSAGQDGKVHLRYGSACRCHGIEVLEHLLDRQAIGALNGAIDLLDGKRWNLILQLREFISDVERDKIATRGKYLAELDEYRSER